MIKKNGEKRNNKTTGAISNEMAPFGLVELRQPKAHKSAI